MGNFLVFLHCNLYSCFADIEWISEKAAIVPDIDPDKNEVANTFQSSIPPLVGLLKSVFKVRAKKL